MSQPADTTTRSTEIIAVSSGKGGTGKTLFTACLGYALHQAGHSVLLIDADTGTDGLSLFLLGDEGPRQSTFLSPDQTVRGILERFRADQTTEFKAFHVNRTYDHEVSEPYAMLISGKGLYGDEGIDAQPVPIMDRDQYGQAWAALFDALRGNFDYVLVDTRGGFAYESTDVAARADSFILVTEPDLTSFYQDTNLVRHISSEAERVGRQATLSAVIVNKATEGKEESFRSILARDLPVKFEETFPVPLDLDAIRAYKMHQVPFVHSPGAPFCSALISAMSDILHVVVAQWSSDRIERWNQLVRRCAEAFEQRRDERRREAGQSSAAAEAMARAERLEQQVRDLEERLDEAKRDKEQLTKLYEHTVTLTSERGSGGEAAMAPPPPPSQPSAPAPAAAAGGRSWMRWLLVATVVLILTVVVVNLLSRDGGFEVAVRKQPTIPPADAADPGAPGQTGQPQRIDTPAAVVSWPEVEGARGYLVQFEGAGVDADSTTWYQTIENRLEVPPGVGRPFRWRVRAVSDRGVRGPASEWYRQERALLELPAFSAEDLGRTLK